mmetsp:Transcript_19621/g.50686  ORF Transcript_19621/g.50686 Transcript_19621/m.50686 type:complete len:315 (-) Transcript_19621:127-1071(-)
MCARPGEGSSAGTLPTSSGLGASGGRSRSARLISVQGRLADVCSKSSSSAASSGGVGAPLVYTLASSGSLSSRACSSSGVGSSKASSNSKLVPPSPWVSTCRPAAAALEGSEGKCVAGSGCDISWQTLSWAPCVSWVARPAQIETATFRPRLAPARLAVPVPPDVESAGRELRTTIVFERSSQAAGPKGESSTCVTTNCSVSVRLSDARAASCNTILLKCATPSRMWTVVSPLRIPFRRSPERTSAIPTSSRIGCALGSPRTRTVKAGMGVRPYRKTRCGCGSNCSSSTSRTRRGGAPAPREMREKRRRLAKIP